jgi:hypothetical protein
MHVTLLCLFVFLLDTWSFLLVLSAKRKSPNRGPRPTPTGLLPRARTLRVYSDAPALGWMLCNSCATLSVTRFFTVAVVMALLGFDSIPEGCGG